MVQKRVIIGLCILGVFIFFVGYTLGIGFAIDKCADVAFNFLDENGLKVTNEMVAEYLRRAGFGI